MYRYCFGGRVDPSNPLWVDKAFPQNLFYLYVYKWYLHVQHKASFGLLTISPPPSHHNRLNFNTYKEGMMTLFILLVVNDWNIISGNFVQVRERNQQRFNQGIVVLTLTSHVHRSRRPARPTFSSCSST